MTRPPIEGGDAVITWWDDKVRLICDTESREERIRLLSLFTLANGIHAGNRLKRLVKHEWDRRRATT